MKTRTLLSFVGSALVMGGTMVGCAAGQTHLAAAGSRAQARTIGQAETAAANATAALRRGRPAEAVTFAETAASLRPQDGTYRALLGRAYLAGGRFASARQALADALALDPGQSGVALSLALAETACGDVAAARQTLADHAAGIAAADRGLALALAGDTAGGVEVLQAAARAPDANAKVRQNYALALALAGRWPEARSAATIDLPPADADRRIAQWATFARPVGPADQVAALLGVTPVADGGQPATLALVAPANAAVEAAPVEAVPAEAAPVEIAMPETPAPASVQVEAAAPAPPPAAVVFGPRREVVQSSPVAIPAAARGGFVVQLGAYRTTAAARDAWRGAQRKYALLDGRTPSSVALARARGSVYRLSVGGFARAEATELCGKLRAAGGACFVRAGAGDRTASWVRPVALAAR